VVTAEDEKAKAPMQLLLLTNKQDNTHYIWLTTDKGMTEMKELNTNTDELKHLINWNIY